MRARLSRLREQGGESLLELVVTILILGVCVVAIGTGIALSIKISSVHRGQATAQAFLHNYAEAVQGSYTACSGGSAPNYVSVASLAAPSGFNAPTASVRFWDKDANGGQGAFDTSTCPGTDPGLQQVTFTLNSTDGNVTESLVTVVRKTT